MKAEAYYLYKQGLLGIAGRQKVSIPEATIIALHDVTDKKYPKLVPEILTAAQSLDPGTIYTHGLWRIGNITAHLRLATERAIADLEASVSVEHTEPTKKAFTWHTGEDY